MKRGRPVGSVIRQNIIELLAVMRRAYGYQIHKVYIQIFPSCTRESVYYHLHKGVQLQEFILDEVKQEQGDYSWGGLVEKSYYSLGINAKPRGDSRVTELSLADLKPEQNQELKQ